MKPYKIINKIGEGVYSRVYKCTDTTGKVYAMKIYNKDDFFESSGKKEIEFLKQLNGHHYFPQLYDSFNIDGKIHIIQDYLSGNLEDKLTHHTYPLI